MDTPKLIDIVKDNKVVFSNYSEGNLNYVVTVNGQKYTFPVPISDTGGGVFNAEDKATFFTRWIRKAIEADVFWPVR